jgi:hypothetical protein
MAIDEQARGNEVTNLYTYAYATSLRASRSCWGNAFGDSQTDSRSILALASYSFGGSEVEMNIKQRLQGCFIYSKIATSKS